MRPVLKLVCFLFSATNVESYYSTARSCWGCNRCTARPCRRRNLSSGAHGLLEYLYQSKNTKVTSPIEPIIDVAAGQHRHLEVVSPIPCTNENQYCPAPYSNYCCGNKQPDGTLSCGVGSSWGTCTDISGETTLDRCDFSFPCVDGQCCNPVLDASGQPVGGSTGRCSPPTLYNGNLVCNNLIVACNYLGLVDSSIKYDRPSNTFQGNHEFCQGGNRGNGRCQASNNCCSGLGTCGTTVDHCATYAYSWVFKGGGVQNGGTVPGMWTQNASGAVNCGFGVVGNGRCFAALTGSEYGIKCCSPNGWCGTAGTDPLGQAFCAGVDGANIPETICFCANGVPAIGPQDCPVDGENKCSSCFDGYDFDASSNSCVAPSINCPSDTFITKIKFWIADWVNGVISITCSNGLSYPVAAGSISGTTGGSSTVSSSDGFCATSTSVDIAGIEKLTFTYCISLAVVGRQGTVKLAESATSTVSCVAGERALGVQTTASNVGFLSSFGIVCGSLSSIVPTAAPTTGKPTSSLAPTSTAKPTIAQTVAPTAPPAPLRFDCTTGKYITQIRFSVEAYLNVITSIVCVDEIIQINTGVTATLTTAMSGSGFSSSPGYCSSQNTFDRAGVYNLKLMECSTAAVDGPFGLGGGLSELGTTSKSCATGERVVAIETTLRLGYISYLNIVCGPILARITYFTCQCPNGIGGVDIQTPCYLCVACQTGYNLTASGTCVVDFPCICPNGTPATGLTSNCTTCSQCNSDYTLTASSTCVEASTICTCLNGVPGKGKVGCTACIACNSGFGLYAANGGTCLGLVTVSCAAGTFITAMTLEAWDYDVFFLASIICSDGISVDVQAGVHVDGFSVTVDSGSSGSSSGFCAISSAYKIYQSKITLDEYAELIQLKLMECSGYVHGPFGWYYTAGSLTTNSCDAGYKAVGVATATMAGIETQGEIVYLDLICGPIQAPNTEFTCTCLNGVPGLGLSAECKTCLACESGYHLSSSLCVRNPSQLVYILLSF